MSNYASCQMQGCYILTNLPDNVSDHLPIRSTIKLSLVNQKCPPGTKPHNIYPKIDWSKASLCKKYTSTLKLFEDTMPELPIDDINTHASANNYVNRMCDGMKTVIYKAVESVTQQHRSSYKGKYRKSDCWNENCLIARDRQRLWHIFWHSCHRPREGHVFESYKLAKKAYRNACRWALSSSA